MFKEVIQQINGAKTLKMKKQFDHDLYLPTISLLKYDYYLAYDLLIR